MMETLSFTPTFLTPISRKESRDWRTQSWVNPCDNKKQDSSWWGRVRDTELELGVSADRFCADKAAITTSECQIAYCSGAKFLNIFTAWYLDIYLNWFSSLVVPFVILFLHLFKKKNLGRRQKNPSYLEMTLPLLPLTPTLLRLKVTCLINSDKVDFWEPPPS